MVLAYPENRVSVERHRDKEQLQPVHPVSQDVATSQVHGHDRPAQLEQREETPNGRHEQGHDMQAMLQNDSIEKPTTNVKLCRHKPVIRPRHYVDRVRLS